MPGSDDDIRLRLSDAIRDVQHLLASGATKDQLRIGTQNRHGLNHVNELLMMLPEGENTAEFRITR